MDITKEITNVATILETRLTSITLKNVLDAVGEVGSSGKYLLAINSINEQQTSNRDKILVNGSPVRSPSCPIEIDAMTYKDIVITRDDNTTFTLGDVVMDFMLAMKQIKKDGLPVIEVPVIVEEEV
jgi:hypothetical protein